MGLLDFFKKKDNEVFKDENIFKIVDVFQDDKLLLKLIGIKTERDVTFSNNEKSIVIAFETSIGVDFVKVIASYTRLGIGTEGTYASGMYPGFEKVRQSLLDIKINGVILPCDLIHYKNKETGEEKDIYYEISSFFGK